MVGSWIRSWIQLLQRKDGSAVRNTSKPPSLRQTLLTHLSYCSTVNLTPDHNPTSDAKAYSSYLQVTPVVTQLTPAVTSCVHPTLVLYHSQSQLFLILLFCWCRHIINYLKPYYFSLKAYFKTNLSHLPTPLVEKKSVFWKYPVLLTGFHLSLFRCKKKILVRVLK